MIADGSGWPGRKRVEKVGLRPPMGLDAQGRAEVSTPPPHTLATHSVSYAKAHPSRWRPIRALPSRGP